MFLLPCIPPMQSLGSSARPVDGAGVYHATMIAIVRGAHNEIRRMAGWKNLVEAEINTITLLSLAIVAERGGSEAP